MTNRVIGNEVEYEYQAGGRTLQAFHDNDEDFVRILIGPLGSGKTQSAISEMLHRIHNQAVDGNGRRRSRWVVARNTLPDLFTTTIKDFREITDQMNVGLFSVGTPPAWVGKYERQEDGTLVEFEVIFLAFDHPDDQKKARGLQLSGCWFNEMKELSRSNVDMLMSRVGRFPPRAQVPEAWSGAIGDTNAPDRDHWLIKLALETKPEGWWFGIQPGGVEKIGGEWQARPQAENVQNLPKNYYKRLLSGRPESWIRQNLANEFVFHQDGRAVHDTFSEQLHVRPVRPTPIAGITVGIDFGRTPAAAICQEQSNGAWYVLDEVCTENTGALEFGRVLNKFLNERYSNHPVQFWGDPAGNQHSQTDSTTPFMMLEKAGITAWPTHTNDYEERTTVLDIQLSQIVDGVPAFLVDPKCTTLIKGLAGAYMFRRVRVSGEDRFHDQPVKDATSHVVEALHYAMLGKGLGEQLFSQHWQEEYESVESWAPNQKQFE